MKYTITINQLGIAESGLADATDIVDWAILEYVKDWAMNPKAVRTAGAVWINLQHMIKQMPLLGIKSKGPISARLGKLRKLGLIECHHDEHQRLYVLLTALYHNTTTFTADRSPDPGGVLRKERSSRSPAKGGVLKEERSNRSPGDGGVLPEERGVLPEEQGTVLEEEHRVVNQLQVVNQDEIHGSPDKSEQPGRSVGTKDFPPWFVEIWAMVPRREGSNPKRMAYQALRARLKEGAELPDVSAGLARYKHFCEAKGLLNTDKVMQAKRFFGPEREWTNPWTITQGGSNERRSRSDDDDAALERYLQDREQLATRGGHG